MIFSDGLDDSPVLLPSTVILDPLVRAPIGRKISNALFRKSLTYTSRLSIHSLMN